MSDSPAAVVSLLGEAADHLDAGTALVAPEAAPMISAWLRSTARLAATYTARNLGDVDDVGAVQLARLVLRGTDSDPT